MQREIFGKEIFKTKYTVDSSEGLVNNQLRVHSTLHCPFHISPIFPYQAIPLLATYYTPFIEE